MVETGNLSRMGMELPLGNDVMAVRRRIELLEQLLEGVIEVPGLKRKVGLDALLGLVPVGGDVIALGSALPSAWLMPVPMK